MLNFLHDVERRAAGRRLAMRAGVCVGLLLAAGLVPAVVAAPAASAATSPLTASSPPNFGPALLGLFGEQNVKVTNTGSSSLEINVDKTFASLASLEFLPAPASPSTTSSCLNQKGDAVPIAAHGTCTLGIFFFPSKFGPRSTTMNIIDSAGGTLRLAVAGTGVGGYFMGGAKGEWTTLGSADVDLQSSGLALHQPVVGMAATPFGLWLVASDGGVFTAGSAGFYGSTGNVHLAKPVVGIAATPDGKGYWLVASDGGIFTFGDAHFFGSTGNVHLAKPIVGMAATPDGKGYWLVASDGGIFTFGDAHFFGSTGNVHLAKPIVGMAASPNGAGYWLVASDGGIFTFGDAHFFGSTGNVHLAKPIVGMAASPNGAGYWLVASDGGIFTFNVPFEGSLGGRGINDVIGMAPTTAPLPPFLLAPASAARAQAGRNAVSRSATTG